MPATTDQPPALSGWVTRRTSSDPQPAGAAAGSHERAARLLLGRDDEPGWSRPLFWALLIGAAVLYLVNLTSSGMANEFYAAAVKSGTESWKAWLFGSLDSANAITVDKPPASLWLMVLSARIFGFSSFSLLLPQALAGIASVGILYAAVKRWAGPAAGLVAGAVLALTPVAALMFRFDNPDALLVLLMTVAAYCVIRAVDSPAARSRAVRWMLLAGVAIGCAFLTKMAQGLLVLPAFGLVYLVAAPSRLRTRIAHLLAAFGAFLVGAGWFVALVELWPASARPYIGGSTNNSLWELAVGYNGLGRIFSSNGSGAGGGGFAGGGNTSFGGASGVARMFGTAFGTQISWLLPAALIALVAGLWLTRRAPRTDRTRAGLILWGSWLVVTALVFSFMSGTIHPYYAIALAPAIGAVVGIGAQALWTRRTEHLPRITLALTIAATAVWGFYLMDRDVAGWMSWLKWTMLIGGVLGALALAISAGRLKRLAVAAVVIGTLSAVAGTAAFTVATVATGHSGSTPSAGPVVAASSRSGLPGGQGRPSGMPTGGFGGESSGTNSELTALLDQSTSRWSAAVVGDQSASGYILSTDTAVMAIGGWGGGDASITLTQFQTYVADGSITYFIDGSQGGRGAGAGDTTTVANQISTWVKANYTATTVGGTTVYDIS